MKKVSVIIPFFNGIDWLNEAVESALNQSYKNIEIIVINDGSTEDVSQFLIKFGEKIKYFYQDNQGAAVARNQGMELATGYYLAFLDSDDIWLANKLEKQISFMEEIGAKWSHTGYFYWDPNNNALKNVSVKNEFGDIYRKTFVSIRIATPSVVIAKSIFNDHPELKFPANYRIGQDTKLWQAIAKYYPIALINVPLVKVRLRSNNTYKQTIKLIGLKAAEFKINYSNSDVPKFAKFRNFFFYLYSFIFKLPSTPRKEFCAKCFVIIPFILGRIYVHLLSLSNKKYKNFLC